MQYAIPSDLYIRISLTPWCRIVATIIAPTPLVAANFVILGLVINRLGSCYSRISPKWYTIVFCSFVRKWLIASSLLDTYIILYSLLS